jgi:hypothetical protein
LLRATVLLGCILLRWYVVCYNHRHHHHQGIKSSLAFTSPYFCFLCLSCNFTLSCIRVSMYSWTGSVTGGHAMAQSVEALRYKPKGRGFDSNGVIRIFHWHNPSGHTMALVLTQHLTEMSTRNISWRVERPVRRADNLTTFICRLSWNLGVSPSWKPRGLSRPVIGLLFYSVTGVVLLSLQDDKLNSVELYYQYIQLNCTISTFSWTVLSVHPVELYYQYIQLNCTISTSSWTVLSVYSVELTINTFSWTVLSIHSVELYYHYIQLNCTIITFRNKWSPLTILTTYQLCLVSFVLFISLHIFVCRFVIRFIIIIF